MYLGMKEVLKNYGANAITINCLGGFYGGHIHAYPCLGFHELANEGLVVLNLFGNNNLLSIFDQVTTVPRGSTEILSKRV